MRLTVSIVMTVIVLFFCFFSENQLQDVIDDFSNKTDEISELVKSGEYQKAGDLIEEIEKKWIKNETSLSLYVNHDMLEDIGLAIAKLKPLAEEKDKVMLLYQSEELKVKLIHVKDVNSLSIRTFF